MAAGGAKGAVLLAAVAALVAGGAAGWLLGRASVPKPPPPPVYVNPLADAEKGEVLVLKGDDGIRDTYRVLVAGEQTVLLEVGKEAPGQAASTRTLVVARAYWGPLVILGGDIDPILAQSSVRDFVLRKASFEELRVESLGRTFRCWKVEGERKGVGSMTYWISDELPVHGVVKISSAKGVSSVVEGFEFRKGK